MASMSENEEEVASIRYPKEMLIDQKYRLESDLGHLTGYMYEPLNERHQREEGMEVYLQRLSREAVQLLMNEIFALPTERTGEGEILVKLPKCNMQLPRYYPIKKEKPLTKWEKYAKEKGIQKKSKSLRGKEWDIHHEEWRAKYGYKRANDEMEQWVIETPGGKSGDKDPWTKLKEEKKQRKIKNKKQKEMNLRRNGIGVQELSAITKKGDRMGALGLQTQLQIASTSTASVGKYDQPLRNAKTYRHSKSNRLDDADLQKEKLAQQKLLSKLK